MSRGRKPKQATASSEFAIALEHLKKGLDLLTAAVETQRGQVAKHISQVRGGKQKRPAKGEPAFAMYQVLEKSKRPVKVEALAKKLGKSTQSIRLYLSKYNCFENIRGKGYKFNR